MEYLLVFTAITAGAAANLIQQGARLSGQHCIERGAISNQTALILQHNEAQRRNDYGCEQSLDITEVITGTEIPPKYDPISTDVSERALCQM